MLYGVKVVQFIKYRQEGWFDAECKIVLQDRIVVIQKIINEPSKEDKTTCRQQKRNHLENKLEKNEANLTKKRYRKFYKGIKFERKGITKH